MLPSRLSPPSPLRRVLSRRVSPNIYRLHRKMSSNVQDFKQVSSNHLALSITPLQKSYLFSYFIAATAQITGVSVPFSLFNVYRVFSLLKRACNTRIPGPIEVADDVLYANAHPSMSHMSPDFVSVLGECIQMTRKVVCSEDAQPFLISGSGTLGWDQVAANLVEPGEFALVLNSGYFGDGFHDCLQAYGAKTDVIKAVVGAAVSEDQIEKALKAKKYKILTITHVDTSTGVLSDAKAIADTVKRVSPDTLVILDGVCSVASEDIRMDAWGIDVILTATQKGLGTPPGLSILVASQRAIKAMESRSTPIASYYASWKKWLPIMKAYEAGSAAYFATPPVNLIYAYHASLTCIVKGQLSLADRLALHRQASDRIKDAVAELGLKQVPLDRSQAANGMTAIYLPDGVTAGNLLSCLLKKDIIVAGGIHAAIKEKYFRIGHMGITAVDKQRGDVDRIINGLQEAIIEAKANK